MKKKIVFIIIALLVTQVSWAKKETNLKEGVIPFQLREYDVLVKGKINGHPKEYTFIVDTGGVMLLDGVVVDDLGLDPYGYSGGIRLNTLDLNGFPIKNVYCVSAPSFFSLSHRETGLQLHGMIGSDMLDRFKVTFDYRKKIMVLSTATKVTGDASKGYLLPFTNHPQNNAPMIKCRLDNGIETQVMVDTGQPFPLVLPLGFKRRIGVSEENGWLTTYGYAARWAGTTPRPNFLGRLQNFEMGGIKVKNMMTLFSRLPYLVRKPLLGKDFLACYLTVINYPKNEILFIPYKECKIADDLFSTGLSFNRKSGGGHVKIRGVWKGSPGDKLGFKVGDKILEVDGRPVTGEQLSLLRTMGMDDTVTQFTLKIQRGGTKKTITVKKEYLMK